MKTSVTEPFISSIELVRQRVPDFSRYPFCIPALRNLEKRERTDQMLAELTEDS